ncbi:hypothetical protein AAVH_36828, partial [Aphelenchoides avenae]
MPKKAGRTKEAGQAIRTAQNEGTNIPGVNEEQPLKTSKDMGKRTDKFTSTKMKGSENMEKN